MLPKKYLSIIVLSLLSLFTITSVLGLAMPSVVVLSSAQSSSCPANKQFTWVTEPIPQSLNYLAPSGDSTFMVGDMQWLSLAPFPLEPNGSLDWADSATNWIQPNANFTQWTFHIRPGLTWSNGTAVQASDIATWLSPSYALNPQYDFVGLHTEVTGVQVVNSDTAIVMLNQSDAQLPNRIGTYYYAPMVPPTDVAKGPSDPLLSTPAIGDGPFYMTNYTSGGTEAVMMPNPYWPGPKPSICQINIIFKEDSAQLVPFLVSGQADFAGPMAFGNLAALSGHSNIQINGHGGQFGSFMMYNITSYPYNMTQFRQALAYALNTSAIMQQAVFGYGVAANDAQGGIPDTYGSYNSNQHMYQYNVSQALSLLQSIGFTGGGSPSSPLKFPNGTKYSVTLFTDTNKAWDPTLELQVAQYLENLGVGVSTQTLTSSNLAADYSSNAFNIRNNLVIYSSGGAQYFSPWVSAQQDCNVYGTPGCYDWFAQNAPDGLPHEEWPPFADAWYQSNLTAINNTPATNITGQNKLLGNIQSIRAEYLPVIMLGYPQKLFAYNTQRWTDWPTYFMSNEGQMNHSMVLNLIPAGTGTTTTTVPTTTTNTTSGSGPVTTTTGGTPTTSTTSLPTTTSSSSSSSAGNSTLEYVAIAVVIVIIIGGIAAYMMRRKPAGAAAT
jgi:ABC-type transport system substrate-binding protein